MLCGKFYDYHHHQNGLGHMFKPPNDSFETSVFGTNCKSKEKIKKFQRKRVSKQLLYILIRAFSKIRILS